MKQNIQKDISLNSENEKISLRKRIEIKPKSNCLRREETITRLISLNSDIEKLYKKYNEIKKERLIKEKSQQILVNRLKYLRNEAKRSLSKKDKKELIFTGNDDGKNKKILVKINSMYKNNMAIIDKYKESNKQGEVLTDDLLMNKTSFNINHCTIRGSHKSLNSQKKNKNNKNSSSKKIGEKENFQNKTIDSVTENKTSLNNVEELLNKFKYNIRNKNSNNNIYI